MILNCYFKSSMKQLLIIALLTGVLAACNNAGRDSERADSTTIEDRRVDTSLNRPGDSMRQDTIRMDTSNRPAGGTDSIRQKY